MINRYSEFEEENKRQNMFADFQKDEENVLAQLSSPKKEAGSVLFRNITSTDK